MTEEHAHKIVAKKKNRHALPGRMGSTALRSAIVQAVKDLRSKNSRLSGTQRFKLLMAIESWRQELKIIEMETLEAEQLETLAEAKPARQGSDSRSPWED
jgi:hypothetical protein